MNRARTIGIAAAGISILALVGASFAPPAPAEATTIAAASANTVTISGVVPAGARADVTVSVSRQLNGKEFGRPGKAHRVDPTTGAFSLSISKSTKLYSLLFTEGPTQPWFDTWLGGISGENGGMSDDIQSFSASSNQNLGTIDILEAGVIGGTVTTTAGKPIYGAQVVAAVGDESDWELIGFSDKAGHYSVKVPRADAYSVEAWKMSFESTYYPSAQAVQDAVLVTPAASNGWSVTGVDIQMQGARAAVTGSFITAKKPRAYEAFLYALDGEGHPIASVPVQSTDRVERDFYFSELGAVSYGIAFRDAASGKWLPWKAYTGSRHTHAKKATAANRCLLPYTGVRGPIVQLGKITVGGKSCGEPFTGAGSFSGAVTNAKPGTKIVASLYYLVPGSDPTPDDEFDSREQILVNHTVVGADGAYALDGVSTPGTYVAKFSVSAASAYFDTLLGGYLLNADGSQKNANDSAPVLGQDQASVGNDVALVEAAYLHGTVTHAGKNVVSANVGARQGAHGIDDGGVFYEGNGYDKFAFARTDSHGNYSLKIVQGLDYFLSASKSSYFGVYGPIGGDSDGTAVTASSPGVDPGDYSIVIAK